MQGFYRELTVPRELAEENAYIGDEFSVNLELRRSALQIFSIGEPRRFTVGRMMRVIEGRISYSINLEPFSAGTGSVIVVPAGAVVELTAVSDPVRLQALAYRGDTTERVLLVSLDREESIEYEQGITAILHSLRMNPSDTETARHIYSAMLSRIKYLARQQMPQSRAGQPEYLFHRFLESVNANASGSARIPFYAGQLNVSPHYLSSLVKEVSGRSVMDWNHKAVIQRAKLMLLQGMTATQTADALDFPNLPYFSRFFKRHTGLTPGGYKKEQ